MRPAGQEVTITPAALRATRARRGLSPSDLGRAAGVSAQSIGALARSRRSCIISHAVRITLLERGCELRDIRLRPARRARAALAWADHPKRAALQKGAKLLDATGSAELADFLLRARPDRIVEVATGTAVHALLRGETTVFDALMEAGLIDEGAFEDAYYDVEQAFVWGPTPNQLLP